MDARGKLNKIFMWLHSSKKSVVTERVSYMRKECSSIKAAGGCENEFLGYCSCRGQAEEICKYLAETPAQHYYLIAWSRQRQEEMFFFRTGRTEKYFLHELPEYWKTRGQAFGAIQHLRSRFPEFNEWRVVGTYLYVCEVQ